MVNIPTKFINPSGFTGGIFYLRQFALLILLFAFTRFNAQPAIKVKDAKLNFGFVKRGKLVKNLYLITNTGNQPLTIMNVEIACSCTTVDYPKQPVLPGESVTVTVNFNTTTVYGRQDREVFLISNDPGGPVKLRYKGIVTN